MYLFVHFVFSFCIHLFKLHHLVVKLIELLGSPSAPEKHIERLQKEEEIKNPLILNTVVTQSCVKQLIKNSPNPKLFIEKYEELILKKIDLLGPFMQLLEFISVDRELKKYLTKNSSLIEEPISKSTIITNEDLPKIYNQFLNFFKFIF